MCATMWELGACNSAEQVATFKQALCRRFVWQLWLSGFIWRR